MRDERDGWEREAMAWRAWNDRDPFEPDRGLEEIENARAANAGEQAGDKA